MQCKNLSFSVDFQCIKDFKKLISNTTDDLENMVNNNLTIYKQVQTCTSTEERTGVG